MDCAMPRQRSIAVSCLPRGLARVALVDSQPGLLCLRLGVVYMAWIVTGGGGGERSHIAMNFDNEWSGAGPEHYED
jgi:hypothetical protein